MSHAETQYYRSIYSPDFFEGPIDKIDLTSGTKELVDEETARTIRMSYHVAIDYVHYGNEVGIEAKVVEEREVGEDQEPINLTQAGYILSTDIGNDSLSVLERSRRFADIAEERLGKAPLIILQKTV